MLRKRLIIILALVQYQCLAFCQNEFDNSDFTIVDSIARAVKYENDLFKLTKDLTESQKHPIYKARSIFIWITDNIKYDYDFINRGKEIAKPDCEGLVDCTERIKDWENDLIKSVLKRHKAICFGYSWLFKRMCDIANIECEIVDGYTKQEPYQIGIPLSVNHAWNAIRIDGKYYFLDATWAAGYCTKDEETDLLIKFNKEYNNYYWLTPFDKLVRNHYPKNGKWVMRDYVTKEKFFKTPYYASGALPVIELLAPSSGIIETRECDTIHFKIYYKYPIEKIQINSNLYRNPSLYTEEKITRRKIIYKFDSFALKKQIYIPFYRIENIYYFDYVVQSEALYYIDVLFDRYRVMRFKVNVSGKNKKIE